MKLLFIDEADFSTARRQFLKTAAVGAAVTAASSTLVGCGSFDRWVMGDNSHLNEEVMILGGGLSGLAAAYHLKKSKIRYKLFEASSRLGGRIQSLRHFNADQQVAEMGGEFFESSHTAILQLCKDLNIPTTDVTYNAKSDHAVYWIKGRVISEKDFKKLLRPIALKIAQARQEIFATMPNEVTPRSLATSARAQAVDQKSLADFLEILKNPGNQEVLECFESICVSEWGVEAKDINLLQFLTRLDFEERAVAAGSSRMFRVEGGASRLIDTLGERVQGVVAESALKLEHQLVAIRSKWNGFECTFKTGNGSDVIWARQIICTLPWSVLKDVDGIQNLNVGPTFKDLLNNISYATHSKVVSSFKDPFWKKKRGPGPAFQGIFRGTLQGQNYWDSSRGQAGTRGLITSQRGGIRGKETNVNATLETLKDLRNFNRDLAPEETSQVTNWLQKPFSKGSRLNAGPGRYLQLLEFMNQENSPQTFYFAGEHMSFKGFGTMNGALESATVAADKALQKAFLKTFI